MKIFLLSLVLVLVLIVVILLILHCITKGEYSTAIKEGEAQRKTKFQVHEDGSFRILQITDMHLVSNGTNKKDKQTLRWLKEAIDRTKPDLVEMTGDITGGWQPGRDKGILAVANVMEEKQVYWAYTFGNHDGEHIAPKGKKDFWVGRDGKHTEVTAHCSGVDSFDKTKGTLFYGDNTCGNEEIYTLLQGYQYSLLRRDSKETEHADLMGVGNYVIELVDKNDIVKFALIHMDTHGKTYVDPKGNKKGPEGYKDVGYVGLTDMQIEWYKNIVKPYSEKGIKTALFMHVPHYGFHELVEDIDGVKEFNIPTFKEKENVKSKVTMFPHTKFIKEEYVDCAQWDEGLENVIANYPSTNLISVGHDHDICFYLKKDIANKAKMPKQEKQEILLVHGKCSGVNAWGRKTSIGATVFDIHTNGNTLEEVYKIKEIYPSFPYSKWN